MDEEISPYEFFVLVGSSQGHLTLKTENDLHFQYISRATFNDLDEGRLWIYRTDQVGGKTVVYRDSDLQKMTWYNFWGRTRMALYPDPKKRRRENGVRNNGGFTI